YDPGVDVPPELDPDLASCFQSLIRMINMMVELGHIVIAIEVAVLSLQLALLCEGLHLNSLFMDLTYPNINDKHFPVIDWKEFYGNVKEPIPPNAPKSLGKPVDIHMVVDSDHQRINRPDFAVAAS
ncbi:hypothetical protein ACHAXS_000092, partial [Conticribra weissflogii]